MDPSASALRAREFDVLIVGGGIYGATLAWHAARAGWAVALIERGDFGEGASANSLKILHGGLRYLQQANISRMRASIKARRDGLASLPYLTRATTCIAPARNFAQRSRAAYHIAAALNDIISIDRNRGVPSSHHLPRTRVPNQSELDTLLPGAAISTRGALLWGDGFMENSERYTLAYMLSARSCGAEIANYTEAVALLETSNGVYGVTARNIENAETFEIRARLTIHAGGGWLPSLWPGGKAPPPPTAWVRSYNLVTRRSWFGEYGVGLDNGRRNFFFMPWRGGTIIGTEYQPYSGSPSECRLTAEDIANFVDEINLLHSPVKMTPDDVTMAHLGLVPARTDRFGRGTADASNRTVIVRPDAKGVPRGFLAISGIKYTTAAYWAARLMPCIAHAIGRPYRPSAPQPLYGSERVVTENEVARETRAIGWPLDAKSIRWLISHYGARSNEILAIGAAEPALRALIPGTPAPAAAIIHAVRRELSCHLTDVLLRRTDLGTAACPPPETLNATASIMADEYGWQEDRRRAEIDRVYTHYQRLGLNPRTQR